MDHHTSWFSFLPFYEPLRGALNDRYASALWFPAGQAEYEAVHHVFAAVLVVLTLMAMSLYARFKLKDIEKAIIPSNKLTVVTFFELVLEVVMGLMESVIGKDYKRYVPMIGTCALFILYSNLLGLIPGFVPPTDNMNTTAAAALVIFLWFNFHGFRVMGIKHITHLMNPVGEWWGWFLMPLLFPVELFSLLVRPLTLSLRLAANMIGDHNVLFAFAAIFPLFLPLPFYFLGLIVCLIQTAVFCILSCVYISLHTQHEEDH